MADNMDIEKLEVGRQGCDLIEAIAQKVDISRQNASTAFAPLTTIDPDVGTHLINELTTSLEEIQKFLKDVVFKSADEYYKKEEDNDDIPDTTPQSITPDGPGVGPGGGTPKETIPDTTPATTPDTTPSTSPIIDPDTNLVNINTKPLEEMKLSDLFGLMTEFIGLAEMKKMPLDELLASDVNADAIKEVLLKCPSTPKELKEAITDLDSQVVRKFIYDLLSGKYPEVFDLNNLNRVSFYKYLEIIAKNNGISVEELLKDSKYSKLLQDSVSGLDKTVELFKGWEEVSDETFQEQLKMFYYGDVESSFPDQDIYAARAYVDYLATECEVDYEELLNDKDYADDIQKGAQEFGKTLSFFNSISFFDQDNIQSTINSALSDIVVKERLDVMEPNATPSVIRAATGTETISDNMSTTTSSSVDNEPIENMYNPE